MAYYYIIWILSMLIMAFPCKSQKTYKIQLLFCFILLFIFGAFREDFGNDYEMYEIIFDNYAPQTYFSYDPESHEEIGYAFLNFICPTYRSLIIITTLFVCFTYYVVFIKYIPRKFRIIAIFFLYLMGNFTIFFMFVAVRNSISIAILLLSFPLILQRKIWLFVLVTLIGASFHTSSFIAYPVAYLMGYIKQINNKTYFISLIIAICISFLSFSILLFLSEKFIISSFDRYEFYQNQAVEFNRGASILVSISNILLIGLTLYSLKNKNLPRNQILIVFLGLISYYAFLLGSLNMRMNIYFSIFTIPAVLISYRNYKNKIMGGSLLLLYTAYYSYSFISVFLNDENFNHEGFRNLVFDSL